ncbi:MAG: PIN domain-containing protein [Limisphaerales bacterium]
MIVDTNALSAFAERNQAIRDALAKARGPYLPVIVLGEYLFGLLSSREREKRERWLYDLAAHWTILPVSAETARHYAEIRQTLKTQATPIPSNDAWIAALAREHSLPILSNDPHFDKIGDVQRIHF